jgi:ABC-type branched-subunit amino acid transport system substrate-binding protein
MIQAISKSDGTRAGVAGQLFKVSIPNGILGPIAFNKNGDVSANPVSIYRVVKGQSTTFKVIVPKNSLVASA